MTAEGHPLDGSSLAFELVDLDTGDRLAECVDTAGQVGYWLMRPLCPRHEATAVHGSVDKALHEGLGPLPRYYQEGLMAARLRCGRPRRDRRLCRTEVTGPGEACHHHREPERLTPSSSPESTDA